MEKGDNPLPCGYVTGVHEGLVSEIPGLKRETWGTPRVFPMHGVQDEGSSTGSQLPTVRSIRYRFFRMGMR